MIGKTMFVTGVSHALSSAPISGRLMGKVDPRLMIAIGFIVLRPRHAGKPPASRKDWDFYELLVPQILRGVSLMMCMVPILACRSARCRRRDIKAPRGLFNLTRNLGGAIGLALINTLLNDRTDLHLARLHERVAWGRQAAEEAARQPDARPMRRSVPMRRSRRRSACHCWCGARPT